jgi:hypothetical protein
MWRRKPAGEFTERGVVCAGRHIVCRACRQQQRRPQVSFVTKDQKVRKNLPDLPDLFVIP